MKKSKIFTKLFIVILIVTLVSCSGDDDGGQNTRVGFFPKQITQTISSSSTEVTTVFTYNDKNQIIELDNEGSTITFGYNDNGQITLITDVVEGESFAVEYNGIIVDRIVDNTTNSVIEVDYMDGTYNFDGGTRTFDSENRVIDTGATSSITYNANSGPFSEIDFQPVLFFLGGSSVTTASYFFAKNEVSSFTITLGGELTCETTRDTDTNITRVSVKDGDDIEIYTYVITYEERIVNL